MKKRKNFFFSPTQTLSMELVCFPKMSYRARKRLLSQPKRYGKEVKYKPHTRMVKRLVRELGWTQEAVRDQLVRERKYLINRDGLVGKV